MNSLNLFDRIVAERDPTVWTDLRKTTMRNLVSAYIDGTETALHFTAIKALVPARTLTDPDSSKSLFGMWLMRRAHATLRNLDNLE
jgi:hypothetical protein